MSYLEPALPLLLLLGVCDLIRKWRTSTRGSRPWLQTLSTAGILLLSLNAVAWLVSRPLEMWYSPDPRPAATADAIVVLAGSVRLPSPDTPYPVAGQDTYLRLQRAIWLFHHWKPLPILVCGDGGDGHWYGETMRRALESQGIPPALIWTESRSRSTRENAMYGAEILKAHMVSRIALVVDAGSMPRAAASFRKFGITVEPAPSRFTRLNGTLRDLWPEWRAIAWNGETLHELGGILWYKLRGWI